MPGEQRSRHPEAGRECTTPAKFLRGARIRVTRPGLLAGAMGRLVSAQALSEDPPGIARWLIQLDGTHPLEIFRADQFEVIDG